MTLRSRVEGVKCTYDEREGEKEGEREGREEKSKRLKQR